MPWKTSKEFISPYLFRNAGETEIFYNSDDLGDFSPSRKTVIMTHGFNDGGDTQFLVDSKDLLLEKVGSVPVKHDKYFPQPKWHCVKVASSKVTYENRYIAWFDK